MLKQLMNCFLIIYVLITGFTEESTGRIPMGRSSGCDDGKTNLKVDWDGSPVNYTCSGEKIKTDYKIDSQKVCEKIPKEHSADHKCMSDVINYPDGLTTYGTHRPVWAVYGEYKFLPRQRWLHNMEHGGVVMLYHPCANSSEVESLRKLVTGCLRRYIITPSHFVSQERPFALLTWGCRLVMSYIDPKIVQDFIRQHGIKGPEKVARDGSFNEGLLQKSKIVSDMNDSNLCPK